MADEKRIIEFEPATDLENDDWLAVDSANVGTRKIQKSMFMSNEIASISQLGVDMIGAQANIENLQTRAGMATALNFGDNLTDGVNTLKTIEGTDAYVNTATYAVGDYCIYNKTLYKCIIAVTSGEDFDPSKWTATSIKNEFSELNSNLANKLDKTSAYDNQSLNQTFVRAGGSGTESNSELYYNSALRIACLSFRLTTGGSLAVGSTYNIGNINSVALPKQTLFILGNRRDGGNTPFNLEVTTNGACTIKPLATVPSGVQIVAECMYFTQS